MSPETSTKSHLWVLVIKSKVCTAVDTHSRLNTSINNLQGLSWAGGVGGGVLWPCPEANQGPLRKSKKHVPLQCKGSRVAETGFGSP